MNYKQVNKQKTTKVVVEWNEDKDLEKRVNAHLDAISDLISEYCESHSPKSSIGCGMDMYFSALGCYFLPCQDNQMQPRPRENKQNNRNNKKQNRYGKQSN